MSVPTVYLNIVANEDGSITYTAYSDAEMTTTALYSYTLWPAEWTEYVFAGTCSGGSLTPTDTDPLNFHVTSDGKFVCGMESMIAYAKTDGYWGYLTDGTLVFVKSNGNPTEATGNCDYCAFEMKTSGNSVTLGFDSNAYGTCTVTIPDIGCLAGNAGYDFTTLTGWDEDTNLFWYTGFLTSSEE